MDQKTLYEKAEKAINQAFQVAKKSAKVISEETGKAAHTTKLLIKKVNLEHQVSKKFAEIGNRVYEKALSESRQISLEDSDLRVLIEDTKRLEGELSQVEANLKQTKGRRRTRSN